MAELDLSCYERGFWRLNSFSLKARKNRKFHQLFSYPTIRDSTFVLDAILDNENDLLLFEHTTDTAGYSELMFALFDLLGLQFSPRIRDLSDQQLYRLASAKDYPRLKECLKRPIHQQKIVRQWEEMVRMVGSLKTGWVAASLFISKLQSFPRQNSLT